MNDFTKELSNEILIGAIEALDLSELPWDQRTKGDDQILIDVLEDLHVNPLMVNRQLIGSLIMREALHRGLTIPKGG